MQTNESIRKRNMQLEESEGSVNLVGIAIVILIAVFLFLKFIRP